MCVCTHVCECVFLYFKCISVCVENRSRSCQRGPPFQLNTDCNRYLPTTIFKYICFLSSKYLPFDIFFLWHIGHNNFSYEVIKGTNGKLGKLQNALKDKGVCVWPWLGGNPHKQMISGKNWFWIMMTMIMIMMINWTGIKRLFFINFNIKTCPDAVYGPSKKFWVKPLFFVVAHFMHNFIFQSQG